MFRINSNNTYYDASPVAPYTNMSDLKRLFRLYQQASHKLTTPLVGQISYHVTEEETVVLKVLEGLILEIQII
jgi:hypothetical protein